MNEGVVLGVTPDGEEAVLDYSQRRQHTYVIGVNGTGKTTLLRQIAHTDLLQEPKHGLCVIDPHGDLIDDILALVPPNRMGDVILFDPSDEENPFCLNPFAPVPPPEEVGRVSSEIVAIFRKIFGGAWTPEIEGVIQNVTLTLLCRPRDFKLQGQQWVPALDEIPALLGMEMVPEEDREKPPWKRKVTSYRSQFYELLQQQDQIPVWEFWNYSFDTLTPRPRSELTFSVLNQVRRFLANPAVRNIVAQTESRLDLSTVLDEGRILLVKLSKGLLGESNSAFLGSIIVAKLVVAVFARASIEPRLRRPFHVIVDEFQNFAISSFPTLLSEARKYNVDLVVAHQYRDQLRDWVQGATVNAGNLVCFRLAGNDAQDLARELDATPPPTDPDFRPLFVPYFPKKLDAPLGGSSPTVETGTRGAILKNIESGAEIVKCLNSWQKRRFGRDIDEEASIGRRAYPYYLALLQALSGSSANRVARIANDGHLFRDTWIGLAIEAGPHGWAGDALESQFKAFDLLKVRRPARRKKGTRPRYVAPGHEHDWEHEDEEEGLEETEEEEEDEDMSYEDQEKKSAQICRWLSENRPRPEAVRLARTALAEMERLYELHEPQALFVHDTAWNIRYTRYVRDVEGRAEPLPGLEQGPSLHEKLPGRTRPYSDVYQERANELTHLPNFCALAKLSGSDAPPVELAFRTLEWPKGHEDLAEREKRQRHNREAVLANTVRDFTRPRTEVVAEFRARYETMLRSIGMSWSPGEPLPKPQVLYEEDD